MYECTPYDMIDHTTQVALTRTQYYVTCLVLLASGVVQYGVIQNMHSTASAIISFVNLAAIYNRPTALYTYIRMSAGAPLFISKYTTFLHFDLHTTYQLAPYFIIFSHKLPSRSKSNRYYVYVDGIKLINCFVIKIKQSMHKKGNGVVNSDDFQFDWPRLHESFCPHPHCLPAVYVK